MAPAPIDELRWIEHDDLVRLLAHDARPALVEALGADFYDSSHLPDAFNVPEHATDDAVRAALPDRERTVIVYCTARATVSTSLARRLRVLGYLDVRVYRDGKEGWAEAGLPLHRTEP